MFQVKNFMAVDRFKPDGSRDFAKDQITDQINEWLNRNLGRIEPTGISYAINSRYTDMPNIVMIMYKIITEEV